MLEGMADREGLSRFDIVAHSFGTHVVAWGLRRARKAPRIHTLILSGSVLRAGHVWEDALPKRIGRLINECGHRDNVLILSQALVPLTGMAGRVGFVGLLGQNFVNRYYNFGHSGYFTDASGAPDVSFMRDQWLPLLRGDEPVEEHDERGDATPLAGVWLTILNWLDPVKMATFWLLGAVITLSLVGLLADATLTRERLRSVAHLVQLAANRAEPIDPLDARAINDALSVKLGTNHVLWVDDNPRHNSYERFALGRWGFCIREVPSTLAALAELQARPGHFSLIISDWLRDENDGGKETALAVSRMPEADRPPLIFYVGIRSDSEEHREAARVLGAVDETSNPFRLLALSLGVVAGPKALAAAAERRGVLERLPTTITAGVAWVSRRFTGCTDR
jgi:CheY-like chemotaxis protein